MYVRASEAFTDLINAVLDDDTNHPFVQATHYYPNTSVGLNTFTVSDVSKKVIRSIYETDVLTSGLNKSNVTLPFTPDKDDGYVIFDVYSILDSNNPRSLLNLNYFYNPSVPNAAKMCEIKRFIENDKIIVTNRGIFVEDMTADILRRIRFVTNIRGKRLTTQHIMLFDRTPMIDMFYNSPSELSNLLSYYNVELYDDVCSGIESDEYYGDDDEYGDIDDESRLPTHIGSTRVYSNSRPWKE